MWKDWLQVPTLSLARHLNDGLNREVREEISKLYSRDHVRLRRVQTRSIHWLAGWVAMEIFRRCMRFFDCFCIEHYRSLGPSKIVSIVLDRMDTIGTCTLTTEQFMTVFGIYGCMRANNGWERELCGEMSLGLSLKPFSGSCEILLKSSPATVKRAEVRAVRHDSQISRSARSSPLSPRFRLRLRHRVRSTKWRVDPSGRDLI